MQTSPAHIPFHVSTKKKELVYVSADGFKMSRSRTGCSAFSKGAIAILVWIGLLRACNPIVASSIHPTSAERTIKTALKTICMVTFYLLLPLAGLLADIKFSRYKFAIFSAVLSLSASGIHLAEIVLNLYFQSCLVCKELVKILSYVDTPLSLVSMICFLLSMLLFGLDQLESASTELLSSFIWWYYWAAQLDGLINSIAGCSSHYIQPYGGLVIVCIHISCMVVIIVTACGLKRWFIIYQRTDNPLMLVARVINYARKTKYPTNRSALTYWQNDYPPRLDFGKTKYGGPFTEEQVENVKTFFRLFLLLLCTQMIFIPAVPIGRFHQSINHTEEGLVECLIGSTYFVNFVIALVFIPLRVIFLGNCCRRHKFFSTLLKQIGIGIILSITGKATLAGFDYYAKVSNNNTFCLFSDPIKCLDE